MMKCTPPQTHLDINCWRKFLEIVRQRIFYYGIKKKSPLQVYHVIGINFVILSLGSEAGKISYIV